jgi:hypothetical protein
MENNMIIEALVVAVVCMVLGYCVCACSFSKYEEDEQCHE